MKTPLITLIVASLLAFAPFAPFAAEARVVKVHSYYKPSTHKYVTPHYKTAPNKTKLDNFSTKGNVNPFTGKKGYVKPYSLKLK